MNDIQQVIANKIQEIAFTRVTTDTELIKSGILSSILVVDLATALEEEFSVQIPFNEITVENFSNLLLIEKFIQEKR
jgi:acyl carrier protein